MPKRLAFLIVVLLTLFSWVGPAGAADEKSEDPALILEVMELVRDYHLDKPEPGVLTDGAIRGMLYEIGDPYAEYFDPETLQSFTDALNGDLIGVGVELISHDGYPAVIGVIPGTPAQRGGLQIDDLITAVAGKSTADRLLAEVAAEIRGPQDTSVILTIRRGVKEFDVTLQRAEVHVPSVAYEMLAGKTGYISVNAFGSHTTGEFESALRELRRMDMSTLIIDLRGNGGGYLHEAVDMLDNFLPDRAVAVYSVDNREFTEEIRTNQAPTVTDMPLVVITDLNSASSSEIMAGALRDHGLARLVGGVTYGKGVVQTVIPLSNGGALKITTARYRTPAGTDIDITGLRPDHQVLTRAMQKEVAWQLLNPLDHPDLSFTAGKEALLNGRKTGLVLDVLNVGGREYLPMRPVLESMLYQVYGEEDKMRVVDAKKEKMVFQLDSNGSVTGSNVIINEGVEYIAVDLFPRLNINVNRDGEVYKLERWL
ncbi:MAG: S41 family peptidase [Desulfotomaculaceae bacterium]